MSEQEARSPDLSEIAAIIGYLCVECRGCARRTVFEAGSPPSRAETATLGARLVCRRCGARSARVHRAPSLRDARRWREDRG